MINMYLIARIENDYKQSQSESLQDFLQINFHLYKDEFEITEYDMLLNIMEIYNSKNLKSDYFEKELFKKDFEFMYL